MSAPAYEKLTLELTRVPEYATRYLSIVSEGYSAAAASIGQKADAGIRRSVRRVLGLSLSHRAKRASISRRVQTLLDHFSNVRIINLVDRVDRRREMVGELTRIGADQQSGRIQFYDARRPEPSAVVGWPSVGARGCYESHLNVLRTARDQAWPNVLVLEDDIDMHPRVVSDAQALVQQLQAVPDWGFAYFAYEQAQISTPPRVDGPAQLIRYGGPLLTASFFAVNGPLLGRLVDFLETVESRPAGHPEGGPMHVDGAYATFRERYQEIVTLVSIPKLGHQRRSPSSISPNWMDRMPGVRFVMSMARMLRRAPQLGRTPR